jgi:hypothetical protein
MPLGQIEGVGLSDASALVERHGWAPAELARGYLLLGLLCLTALGAGWALAGVRARARLAAAREAASRPDALTSPTPTW